MRKIRIFAVIFILALMAASCAKITELNAEEFALEVRTDFLKAEKITLNADITADYGDRVYDYTVKFTGNAGAGEILILSPELAAGITAEVTIPDCTLVYDGARLDTGALTEGGLSPAGAIPVLIAEWQSGYIEFTGYERLGETDTASVTTGMDGGVSQKTWFDIKTHLPVRSELYDNGVMVIACVFNNAVAE